MSRYPESTDALMRSLLKLEASRAHVDMGYSRFTGFLADRKLGNPKDYAKYVTKRYALLPRRQQTLSRLQKGNTTLMVACITKRGSE